MPNQLLPHASIVDRLQRHCSLALGVPGAFWIMQSRVGLGEIWPTKGRGFKSFKKFSWIREIAMNMRCQAYYLRAKASMIIDETLITKLDGCRKHTLLPPYLCTQIFLLPNTSLPQSRAMLITQNTKRAMLITRNPNS